MSTAPALHPAPPSVPAPGRVVPMRRGGGEGGADRPGLLAELGMWAALAPIAMLFFSFASAYVVRRGLGSEWTPVVLPPLVWANTAVLLASSVTLELGRRALRRGAEDRRWLWGTFALGVAFLAGQVIAWMQLTGAGIGVSATAYGSFFYVLTGAHAVHLAGGVLALLGACTWPDDRWRLSRAAAAKVTAIYWHFLDVLWVGILLLLVVWR